MDGVWRVITARFVIAFAVAAALLLSPVGVPGSHSGFALSAVDVAQSADHADHPRHSHDDEADHASAPSSHGHDHDPTDHSHIAQLMPAAPALISLSHKKSHGSVLVAAFLRMPHYRQDRPPRVLA
jgi:hypothetical protein